MFNAEIEPSECEKGQFHRANGAFGYLQHSFFSGLLRKKFRGRNGADRQSPLLSGAVQMIQSPAATNSCDKRKRLIQNEGSKQPEMADSADKRHRRSEALQKLEVNRVSSQPLCLLFFATQIISASFEKPCKETAVEQCVTFCTSLSN